MLQLVLRLLALAIFAVLGIVWSGNPDDTTAALWVVSFVLVVFAAVESEAPREGAGLSALWERIPGPSKNPDDYR
ncbi:hypothetical protein [Conexibacter woesei]|uniref:Uncharacterized protein n=1 Tax=Conexibacter woesei (strain DSM 14684 / CCUG 47730 / CIP 108061 / JCM 11494 / NBRC 100937 / ID131577) TaxID=469383 RepID=D3F8S5_CONWI|nr:hypothetical protein [Conexibacter woesei]ADB51039.1 hypothetical protein Cwoe_2620 [Conexibacter woesei DSM 14684]